MIPFKRINLGGAYEAIQPLFNSGMLGIGPELFEFEKDLAEYVGSKYCITFNSCTSAIYLALLWEKEQGLEKVSIPDMTVPLVANAVMWSGLQFDLYDNTSWVGGTYKILGSNVIDSAHELRKNCFLQYSEDSKVCFSFYPTKTIGTSDGGAIATNDEDFYNWARSVSVYGRNQKNYRQNYWDYDIERLGYKFHWNSLNAVIAHEQLKRLDETNAKRQAIVQKYNEAFSLNNTSDYLYRLEVKNRDVFVKYMIDNGIECGVHFKPLHMFEPFKDLEVWDKERTEEDFNKTVSLPLYDMLTEGETNTIIQTVLNYEFYENVS